MGDYQNGFRGGRSVIDNIFVLKIMNKKIWDYNQSLQYLFIDFQKAYYGNVWKNLKFLPNIYV